MKKMWIKKENIYHKPFYKQKLKMTMLAVLLLAIVFLAYQVAYMNQLVLSTVPHSTSTLVHTEGATSIHVPLVNQRMPASGEIRGIRHQDSGAYKMSHSGQFRCLRSGELIPFDRVNDDYCDCADGTDETSTNACPNGVFYCSHRVRHPRAGHIGQDQVPTSRINDGICDCCDGSDEWPLANGRAAQQCPFRCN